MSYRFILAFLLLLSLTFPSSLAQEQYQLKLLAVQESAAGFVGSDADLILELRDQGSGRVFLETAPLTKLDTQISTRFAKEIACNYFNLQCDDTDFIYTISAKSNIIGGPSAGAATAALTAIAVLDVPYDSEIAVTGTINSGGVVGTVGGIKEKLDAAAAAGIKKVLIPAGSAAFSDENDTIALDLVVYGQSLDLEVVEVIDLGEVLFHLTGKNLVQEEITLTPNEDYTEIMQQLQESLCHRSHQLQQEIRQQEIVLTPNVSQQVMARSQQAANATAQNDYYSAASFCFTNNIQLKEYYYQEQHPGHNQVSSLFSSLDSKTIALEQKLDQEDIETISDLQTYTIVKERLNDVKAQIKLFSSQPSVRDNETYRMLAYAEERYFSAVSWMKFFEMKGKKFAFTEQTLRNSCVQKISEADERLQYVTFFIPEEFLTGLRAKVDAARSAYQENEFPLCLITASQAKADANAIMGSLGLQNESLRSFIAAKKVAAERIIAAHTVQGQFPILGYSYYQYALSLEPAEPNTALLYFEYALELADLGIYFPEERSISSFTNRSFTPDADWILFLEGFLTGLLVMLIVALLLWRKRD